MVMQPAKASRCNLQRYMPIAKVIGSAREQSRIIGTSAGDLLGGGLDTDQLTALVREQFAMDQDLAAWQKDAHLATIVQPSTQARA